MYNAKKTQLPRRIAALFAVFCMILPLIPVLEVPASASAASDAAIDQLENWGIINGYPDGQTHPERLLTRAEYVAMVNRAYGYKGTGATPFTDVPETSWYSDDIGIAYNAGYFKGIAEDKAGPTNTLTREQAIVMLGRNMRMDPVAGEVTEFSDGRDFSSWSHGIARAAAQRGIIGGYADGSFKPKNEITRGEMAIMLKRALGELINQSGVHTLSDHYGTVTISSPNTTLKDTTIAGDLYITGGLELGDVTLDNVRVLGNIIVAGGGESQNGNESVILRNVEADSLLVDSMADQYVSLRAEGNTSISETLLRSDAYVLDRTRPGEGLLNITLDSPDPNASFTLSGNLETVVNKTPNSQLKIAMGTVNELTIDEHAKDSTLNLDINSTALTLNLDTAAQVVGVGDIGSLIVNAPGSTVEMLPDEITIRPGLTAEIAGETMDAVKAKESSSDPRLLAGYPKLKNIAPTSATALFSTNKTGTVYWAVSATTDGSIPEDELIDPTEGNTAIALNGSTPAPNGNEEVSASLTNLAPDSNYYLSAVMTDAHNRHSPVKVVSFKTPDNTVPAFATGYPKITQNDFELVAKIIEDKEKEVPEFHVQVAAMPNKTCQLYYALYPTGSVAPTGQQFRTGALGKPIQSGMEEVTKNVVQYIDFYKLEELTSYDLYLWLTDADGKLSSAVQKLTFKTVDGTAPEFQYDTPVVTDIAANSIKLNVNVNENATVYWVAVQHGTAYIKDSDHWEESAQRQIESGTGGVSRGSTAVRKDTDAAITVSGLKPATNYDIYYVAKDTAGNYSRVIKEDPATYMLQSNTLDTEPPTAHQEFTRYPEGEEDTPYANTDVYIVFSEDVMQFTPNQSKAQNDYTTFDTLYDAVKNAATASEKEEAKAKLGNALRATIKLYNAASTGTSTVPDRNTVGNENNWVIDYREARIERHPETDTMMVVFPSTVDENGDGPAINLSSGATYYFVLDDIADTSSSRNRMGRTTLPRFTTISAQVTLRAINVTSIKHEGNDVPIDMAFSLTPVSTNVESNVDWDLIFWSDSSVAFEIYELKGESNKTAIGNYLVEKAGTSSPAVVDIINDNGSGYIGRSLFRHFYDLSFNPSVTGQGNVMADGDEDLDNKSGVMEDGKSKYYGIHFTEVKHASEGEDGSARGAWDATVNFRISVLTGSSVDLGNLSRNITESNLETYKKDWGVAEIHSPNPFAMRKQFANSASPDFYTGYPQITPSDITATIRVMLDRPGTLYYAVAPVDVRQSNTTKTYNPAIGTTITGGQTLTNDYVVSNALTINTTMADASTVVDGIPQTGQKGLKLNAPAPSTIYSPNFGSDTIKTGKLTLGTSYQDIKVDGLTNNTLYFLYVVTQGTGQVYSQNVLLYQFTTTDVNRPKLRLDMNGNSTVNVRSLDMNAIADYGIFLMDSLPTQLSQKFYEAVPSDYYTLSEGGVATVNSSNTSIPNPTELQKYLNKSVYEAMASYPTGGTPYDTYATAEHKDSVRAIITRRVTSDRLIDAARGKDLTQGVTSPVNCEEDFNIKPILQYLFVAEARSTAADEGVDANAYGFAAISPVYIFDQSGPVIKTINATNLVVDYTPSVVGVNNPSGYVLKGKIFLEFDKDLYLFDDATQTRTPLTSGDSVKKNFPQNYDTTATIQVTGSKSAGATASTSVRTVELTMTNTEGNTKFFANGKIVSQYSTYSSQLKFTVSYDRSQNLVSVIIEPKDPWYPAEIATFTPTTVILPQATGFTLTPSSDTTLSVGKSVTLKATITPSGSDGKIQWSVTGGGSYISTSDETDTTITVTGAAKGTPATIKATLVDKFGNPILVNNAQVTQTRSFTVTDSLVESISLVTGANVSAVNATTYNVTIPANTNAVTLEVVVAPDTAANKAIYTTVVSGQGVYSVGSPFQYAIPQTGGVTHSIQVSRTATGNGTFVISAMDGSQKSITVHVTVK